MVYVNFMPYVFALNAQSYIMLHSNLRKSERNHFGICWTSDFFISEKKLTFLKNVKLVLKEEIQQKFGEIILNVVIQKVKLTVVQNFSMNHLHVIIFNSS